MQNGVNSEGNMVDRDAAIDKVCANYKKYATRFARIRGARICGSDLQLGTTVTLSESYQNRCWNGKVSYAATHGKLRKIHVVHFSIETVRRKARVISEYRVWMHV